MTDVRWIADNELTAKWPFWTRANVGEVLPEPPSPLGWDLVWENGTLKGWYDCAVNRMGYADVGLNPERPEMAGLLGGFAYLNATGIRLFGTRTPGMSTEDIDMAYFGPKTGTKAPKAQQCLAGGLAGSWAQWIKAN